MTPEAIKFNEWWDAEDVGHDAFAAGAKAAAWNGWLARSKLDHPEGDARDAIIEECAMVAAVHAAKCVSIGASEKARTAGTICDIIRELKGTPPQSGNT